MRVVVTVQHPAHVHFFRPIVEALTADDHEVFVFAREKDVATRLLVRFGIPHQVLAGTADSLPRLLAVQAAYEYRLWREVRRLEPDVVTAIGGMAAAHVSAVTSARSVVFTDSEVAGNRLTVPFADVVCTPRNFGQEFGDVQVRYDGFHELAYLHPNRFEPDPEALRAHGVDPAEQFAVVRFSDMAAHHDVGQAGLSRQGKLDLVATLAGYGSVFVSAEGAEGTEGEGETDLGGQALPVPPHLVHHLLAFADLFVTDSSTMATEAALLGTPTIRSNSFAGEDDLSNFEELSNYGLVYSTPDERDALDLAETLAAEPAVAAETWRERRDQLLAEKIDVAAFAVEALSTAADPTTEPDALAEVGSRA